MLSVVLGVIGVGGLVWQFASGFIDEFTKTLDDLKARVTALETASSSASTSSASSGTSAATTANAAAITQLMTDLTALQAKEAITCNKVNELTALEAAVNDIAAC